jgi:hypothetical protein
MDDDTFWPLIEASNGDPMSMDEEDHQPAVLTEMLKALRPEEVCAFDATFRRLHHQAYRWDLWAAAYIIEGGCSDDGFTDFRSGLIGLGKKAYYDALADPNTLALQPDRGVDFSQEALMYAGPPGHHTPGPRIPPRKLTSPKTQNSPFRPRSPHPKPRSQRLAQGHLTRNPDPNVSPKVTSPETQNSPSRPR